LHTIAGRLAVNVLALKISGYPLKGWDKQQGLTVRPELVEGGRLSRSWFDRLTTNGLTLYCPALTG